MRKYILLIIGGVFFFFQCTISTSENTENNQTKDSSGVKNDSIIVTELSAESEITCPKCGHKKTEKMPADICLLKYTCEKCDTILHPKEDDCCVFCTYGTHKCPSMQ